jgi:hypothetical protein
MSDARVAFTEIANRVLDTYNTNKRLVVKKMKSKYANIIVALLPNIYYKDKVQYFHNKHVMMISKTNNGKFINWATIMYFQLIKELIKWEKCQKNMVEGIAKKELKKDVCHCRNPTLAKCGGEAQHFQTWGFGALRDSRMFRARQQGPKHLALRCS